MSDPARLRLRRPAVNYFNDESVEHFAILFGREYETIIADALRFLDERKNRWQIGESFNVTAYLKDLLLHVAESKEE